MPKLKIIEAEQTTETDPNGQTINNTKITLGDWAVQLP